MYANLHCSHVDLEANYLRMMKTFMFWHLWLSSFHFPVPYPLHFYPSNVLIFPSLERIRFSSWEHAFTHTIPSICSFHPCFYVILQASSWPLCPPGWGVHLQGPYVYLCHYFYNLVHELAIFLCLHLCTAVPIWFCVIPIRSSTGGTPSNYLLNK